MRERIFTMSFQATTPQSPSQVSLANSSSDINSALATSATTLPTPAHSVNGSTSQQDVIMVDGSPSKRKRALDDEGDRSLKKVHLETPCTNIEDLHMDVGQKYLLCQTRKSYHPLSTSSPQLVVGASAVV